MTKLIPFALPDVGDAEAEAAAHVIKSGWITSGPVVKNFENTFGDFVGASHSIAVNSATTAALLLFDALHIGPGDEVIFPAYTFSGPAMMARRLGAKVILADSGKSDYNISVDAVAPLINSRTRAIVPTHFAGRSADLSGLKELIDGRNIYLIDDAAHAFPAFHNLQDIGGDALTDATFFSFYATKCLTTGEGGMITTKHDWLAQSLRKYRLHGFSTDMADRHTNPDRGWFYDVAVPGWKANMSDISAAIGMVQLHRSMEMWEKRSRIAKAYSCDLAGHVGLPAGDDDCAWHLYPIQVANRDEFIKQMRLLGVQCSVHFRPIHMHSAWSDNVWGGPLVNAADLYQGEVSLPIYSGMRPEQVQQVIDAVTHIVARRREAA